MEQTIQATVILPDGHKSLMATRLTLDDGAAAVRIWTKPDSADDPQLVLEARKADITSPEGRSGLSMPAGLKTYRSDRCGSCFDRL